MFHSGKFAEDWKKSNIVSFHNKNLKNFTKKY